MRCEQSRISGVVMAGLTHVECGKLVCDLNVICPCLKYEVMWISHVQSWSHSQLWWHEVIVSVKFCSSLRWRQDKRRDKQQGFCRRASWFAISCSAFKEGEPRWTEIIVSMIPLATHHNSVRSLRQCTSLFYDHTWSIDDRRHYQTLEVSYCTLFPVLSIVQVWPPYQIKHYSVPRNSENLKIVTSSDHKNT